MNIRTFIPIFFLLCSFSEVYAQPILSVRMVQILNGQDTTNVQDLNNTTNKFDFGTLCLPGSRDRRISFRNVGTSTLSVALNVLEWIPIISSGYWEIRDSMNTTAYSANVPTLISALNLLLQGISPGQRRDFIFRFKPTDETPVGYAPFFSCQVSGATPPTQEIGMNAQAIKPSAGLTMSRTFLDFGDIDFGSSSTQNADIASKSVCPVTFDEALVEYESGGINPHFHILTIIPSGGFTVTSTSTVALSVEFRPLVFCPPNGKMILKRNSVKVGEWTLKGTSKNINPIVDYWDGTAHRGKWQWSNIPYNSPTSSLVNYILNNSGDVSCLRDVTIRSFTVTSPSGEFALKSPQTYTPPYSISAGDKQFVQVHFTPNPALKTTRRNGVLEIQYDSLGGVRRSLFVDLEATIGFSNLTYIDGSKDTVNDKRPINFGKVRLGTSSTEHTISIVNSGQIASGITVPPVVFSPPYQISKQVSTGTIPANGRTSFGMKCIPNVSYFGNISDYFTTFSIDGKQDSILISAVGSVPNVKIGIKGDTVRTTNVADVGSSVKFVALDLWTNFPTAQVPAEFLHLATIDSMTIEMVQPSGGAVEFSTNNVVPFTYSDARTEIFTFSPKSASPVLRRARVTAWWDSVGHDRKKIEFYVEAKVKVPLVSQKRDTIYFGDVSIGSSGNPIAPDSLLVNEGGDTLKIFNPQFSMITKPSGGFDGAYYPLTFSPQSVPVDSALRPKGLVFSPNVAGEFIARMAVQTNAAAPDNQVVFYLKGRGVEPGLQANISTLHFGKVRIGRRKEMPFSLLNNTGSAISLTSISSKTTEFSVKEMLPPTINTKFEATAVFAPQSPDGVRIDTFTVKNSSPLEPKIALVGEGASGRFSAYSDKNAPLSDSIPNRRLLIGTGLLNGTLSHNVFFRNLGTFAYYVREISLSGTNSDQFSLSSTASVQTIQVQSPGDSIEVQEHYPQIVAFRPTSLGVKKALLTISGVDPVSGLAEWKTEIELVGNADTLRIRNDSLSAEIDFHDALVGTITIADGSRDRHIFLDNPTGNIADVVGFSISAATPEIAKQFRVSSKTMKIPPFSTDYDSVRVYFSPTGASENAISAQLVVEYANGLKSSFPLKGRGVAPAGVWWDGVVYTADSKIKTLELVAEPSKPLVKKVNIINTGKYPLELRALAWVQTSANISVDALPNFVPLTLPPNAFTTFTFTFSPKDYISETAELRFTTNHVAMNAQADSSVFSIIISGKVNNKPVPIAVTASVPLRLRAKPSERVFIPISVESAGFDTTQVESMSAVLHFDGRLLVPLAVRTGQAATGFTTKFSEMKFGEVVIDMSGKGNTIRQRGELAVLECMALQGTSLQTPILLDAARITTTQLKEIPLVFSAQSGVFELDGVCLPEKRGVTIGGAVSLNVREDTEGNLVFRIETVSEDALSLEIFNSFGANVATLLDEKIGIKPTSREIFLEKTRLADGMYFAVLRTGTAVRTLPLHILK